jgi:alkanesulfonate monooxygenase SsuD/methylene tetrahydromethanopterin reductase-like flavin-dependent oxidoreductase (luciferase family)
MAKLGVGLLIVPQKPWDDVQREIGEYREIFLSENSCEPPPPLVAGWTIVHEDEERAAELAVEYIGKYYHTVLKHYEFSSNHLKTTKGYEYYGALTKYLDKRGADGAAADFAMLHPWGTPEQVIEKIMNIHEMVGNNGYMAVLSFSGMPYDEAERNMRLFADKVLPALKASGIAPPTFEAPQGAYAATA